MSIQENWERAIPLSEAWLFFLNDGELRSQYQDASTLGATHFAETLIKGALTDRVFSGDLLAIGVPTSDAHSDAMPHLLPPNMFRHGISGIDWNGGTVEGLGRIYHAVHICCVTGKPPVQTADRLASTPTAAGQPDTPTAQSRLYEPRGGRPNEYAKSASVLKALYKKHPAHSLSAAKLFEAFTVEFKRQFPYSDYQIAAPSLRTLRTHLKRFRQELAETGNIQIAG